MFKLFESIRIVLKLNLMTWNSCQGESFCNMINKKKVMPNFTTAVHFSVAFSKSKESS